MLKGTLLFWSYNKHSSKNCDLKIIFKNLSIVGTTMIFKILLVDLVLFSKFLKIILYNLEENDLKNILIWAEKYHKQKGVKAKNGKTLGNIFIFLGSRDITNFHDVVNSKSSVFLQLLLCSAASYPSGINYSWSPHNFSSNFQEFSYSVTLH